MKRQRLWTLTAFVLLVGTLSLGRVGAQSAAGPDLARGQHIATALAGCTDCHGTTFSGGRAFVRAGQTVYASNLTGGTGGVAGVSDADMRRAIRAGIAPDGTRLRVMPSSEYALMTDADVDDLIAFLRTVPAVDRTIVRTVALPASASDAQSTDEAVSRPAPMGGAYLATIGGCTNCHSANLAGGNRFGDVVAPNISHDGIGGWSFTDFTTAMRTGKTPNGHLLLPIMPWQSVGRMTDDELRTVYDFLESKSAKSASSSG